MRFFTVKLHQLFLHGLFGIYIKHDIKEEYPGFVVEYLNVINKVRGE